jgi:hypothetical protein
MLIEEAKLKQWMDHFYGYGLWDAKVWFVGFEETGGETPEEVAAKINFLFGHRKDGQLCDIRELYRHVPIISDTPKAHRFENRYDYRFGSDAALHGVWKNLIAFVHGFTNKPLPDLLDYQKNKFVSGSTPTEALLSFYPLPGPNSHSWYYSWLDLPNLPFLKSRAEYEKHIYEDRIKSILEKLRTYNPDVVLLYGMNNINSLKKSIQAYFQDARFKMVKAASRQIPQHHVTNINGTLLVITTQIPALHHNRPETGFDWEEFGKRLNPG